MNARDRLSAPQLSRLAAFAERLDAKACDIEAAAPRVGGRDERRTDASLDRDVATLRARARSIRSRIHRAQRTGHDEDRLRVSDHALIRYLERRYGLDVAAYAAEIAPTALAVLAKHLGDGEYPVETEAGTHYCTVRDGTVVTVIVHRT